MSLLSATPFLLAATAAQGLPQDLDETWTVVVNGASVPVESDGSFYLPTTFLDQDADGVAEEFVQAIATRDVGGVIEYAYSEFFQLVESETSFLEDFLFATMPPLLPVGIELDVSPSVLTFIGESAQATVTATLGDGSVVDATPQSALTSYSSANDSIAFVTVDGLVVANGDGATFVSAENNGVVASRLVTVTPGSALTSYAGFVFTEAGVPVGGATVSIAALSLTTLSDATGGFFLDGVPVDLGAVSVQAEADIGGQLWTAGTGPIAPEAATYTDAGVLFLEQPVQETLAYALFGNSSPATGNPEHALAGVRVETDGTLTDLPLTPYDVGGEGLYGVNPFHVAITPDGDFLVAQDGNSTDGILSFRIGADGSLTQVGEAPPVGSALNTIHTVLTGPDRRVFVSFDSNGLYAIAVFQIQEDGSFTTLDAELALPSHTAPLKMALGLNGTRLFALYGGGSGGLHVIDVAGDGALSLVTTQTLTAPVPRSMELSADGARLYVTTGGINFGVWVYDVMPDGSLAELASSPLPAPFVDATIHDVTLTPDGTKLYVAGQVGSGQGVTGGYLLAAGDAYIPIPGSNVAAGIVLLPTADGQFLISSRGSVGGEPPNRIWSLRIESDGSLSVVDEHFPTGFPLDTFPPDYFAGIALKE